MPSVQLMQEIMAAHLKAEERKVGIKIFRIIDGHQTAEFNIVGLIR